MMMGRLSILRGNRIHLFEHHHLQPLLELDVLVMKGNIGDYLRFLINLLLRSHLLNLIDIIRVILPGGHSLHHQKPLKYHKDHMIQDIHPSPPKDKDSIHNRTSLHPLHRDYHDTHYRLLRLNLVLLHKNLGDYHNLRYNPIRISECLALKKGLVLS
jgi:hypothetical protein